MPTNAYRAALELFEGHHERLDDAVRAIAERGHWAAYEENFKRYPEADLEGAHEAFEALLHKHFELQGPSAIARAGSEQSPYGIELGVTYDQYDLDELMARQLEAMPAWRDLGAKGRAGVCIEILQRLNVLSPVLAHVVMHTTGQAYPMAFQAGSAHAQDLALDLRVKLVDFTGSNVFGNWLELNARQAQVFTEKAGVNTVILDSVESLEAVAKNLAFSLCLYSGQMCTTPQAILVPCQGFGQGKKRLTFDQVTDALAAAIKGLLADNGRACTVLGAIQSPATLARIEECRELGEVLLDSEALAHPRYSAAPIRTPLLLKVDASPRDSYAEERFGPIAFVIATDDSAHSLQLARELIASKGALTLGVYSLDPAFLDQAEALAQDVAVALSVNLDSSLFVNQSAAFSNFHATGANAAANASFTDSGFVSRRFVVVQSRRPVTAWETADELL